MNAESKDGQIFGSKVAYVMKGDSNNVGDTSAGALPEVQLSKHHVTEKGGAEGEGVGTASVAEKPAKK